MNMSLALTGLWQQAADAFPELRREIPAAMNKAVLQEAQDLRKVMVQQFQKQAPAGGGSWAPLAASTIAARRAQGFGGSKILIRSGDLRNAIAVSKISGGVVFVGVNRTAKGTDKGAAALLANLGLIHEFGATIKIVVTRKMQRYLFGVLFATKNGRDAAGKFVKKGTARPAGSGNFVVGAQITIKIPARPFIGPAVKMKTPEQYEASIMSRMAIILNGKIGK